MRAQYTRVLPFLICLAFGFGALGVSSPAAASDKKKSWPSKKHHKHHKAKPAAKSGAPKNGATGAAPAEEADDDEGGESAEGDEKEDTSKDKAKSKTSSTSSSDDGERRAEGDRSHGDDEGEGDAAVVHRKAKAPEAAAGAPIALELEAGPRGIHRNFDFHDPLSNFTSAAAKPFAYKLPAGPAPFIDLAIYPAAFATRSFASNIGLVASFEKLVGTKTQAPDGSSFSTLAQQLEVGLRGRLPLGENEIGLRASYGKQTFHVAATDPGPGPNGTGSTLPNVDYTFAAIGLDGRLRLSPIELGAHVGTRLVFDTGSLGKNWFSTVKTTSIEAGLSAGYSLSPLLMVVAGVDFLRYGFDFNPNPATMGNNVVAGGAVDQYISGFLALRVTLTGS